METDQLYVDCSTTPLWL